MLANNFVALVAVKHQLVEVANLLTTRWQESLHYVSIHACIACNLVSCR